MIRSLSAAALLALAASCSPNHWSPPAAPPPVHPPPLGYHTAMALVQVGQTTKLYVPTGIAGTPGDIAIVDVGVAGRGTRGAGARVGTISLGGGDFATVIAGDDRVLVAASSDVAKAWIIDPATDSVVKTIPLDGLGVVAHAGQDHFVTAAIVDPDRNRAWLAVWNGLLAIDLARGERVTAEDVLAAPSEAPGYDPVRGLIYSVFESCTDAHGGPPGSTPPPCSSYQAPGAIPMLAGLDVIRVSDGARFTLQRPGASAALPLGGGPDSVAIDTSAGIAIVADEGPPAAAQRVLDLSSLVLDAATHTATLPETAYAAYAGFAGAATAIEPGSGAVLLADEFTGDLAFSTVADLKAGAPVLQGAMPMLPVFPSGQQWVTAGEPHGAAIFHVAGKRYALLLNADHDWLARIDLDKVDGLTPPNPTVLTPADLAPVVTFLDLKRAP